MQFVEVAALLAFARVVLWKNKKNRLAQKGRSGIGASLDPSTYASWYAYVDQSAITDDKREVANRPSRSP